MDLVAAAPLSGARDVEEITPDGGGSGSSGAAVSGGGGGGLGQGRSPRGTREEVQLPLGRGGSLLRHLVVE